MKFWFRYIFKNLSIIEIGDENRLTNKIISDLPNLMGFVFEDLVKEFLRELNLKQELPFGFARIGSYWNRTWSVEVDIVAVDDEKDRILFGECKLSSSKMDMGVINKLKSRANAIDWRREKREEYFVVFTADEIEANIKKAFEGQGIVVYSLKDLILS